MEHGLFVYAGVFLLGFLLESDASRVWVGLIKSLAVLYLLLCVIYGPRRRPGKLVA
jgi:hypothetical protein